jgi:hypothetical protein
LEELDARMLLEGTGLRGGLEENIEIQTRERSLLRANVRVVEIL